MTAAPADVLRVSRPLLPSLAAVSPYLREIDRGRWYSNGGPLVQRFEARLAEHFAGEDGRPAAVAAVGSATIGLTLALLAATGGRGGTCLMPSWTFAASASAVVLAGLTPHFIDVAPDTWLLDRGATESALRAGPVAALLLVTPGGMPVDLGDWQTLAAAHRAALVVDAADGFDSVRPSPAAQVVSLHACKTLGVGEGGLVVSSDRSLIETLRRLANFGLNEQRMATACGLNGKLSEYAAAIGLAGLDQWPATRQSWLAQAERYRTLLAPHGLGLLFDQGRARSTALVDLGAAVAGEIEAVMSQCGIEARRWWGEGCHRQPAFEGFPRGPLAVTEHLAARIIGLPFHRDLARRDARRVVRRLAETLKTGL
jgi:dTDP-4-amino-4,6-dideoxygalactose transaminase